MTELGELGREFIGQEERYRDIYQSLEFFKKLVIIKIMEELQKNGKRGFYFRMPPSIVVEDDFETLNEKYYFRARSIYLEAHDD